VAARFGKLSDAQLVIARELGLPSWPKLKAHIDSLDRTRRAIALKAPPPDGEPATLHLRCGSDIREPLKQAGFVGDFLEVSDRLVLGPLPRDGDLVQVRSRFLGEFFETDAAKIEADYRRTEDALAGARERFRPSCCGSSTTATTSSYAQPCRCELALGQLYGLNGSDNTATFARERSRDLITDHDSRTAFSPTENT